MRRAYASPEAFKRALEDRLRAEAGRSNAPLARLRQLLVFDRFLARVGEELADAVLLKGGVVLELRLAVARTTNDIDFRWTGDLDRALAQLQAAGRRDLGDFLTFELGPTARGDSIDNDGVVYDGKRFRVEPRLAGKLYGMPFGVDLVAGDVLTGRPELFEGEGWLDFVGAPRSRIQVYPRETHVSEKLHAYTMPRPRPNSRVKDLPDLALLAQTGAFEAGALRQALERTFAFRRTHALPTALPAPPDFWAAPYARMARADRLPWKTLEEVTGAAAAFVGPLLEGTSAAGSWDPASWSWS